MDGKEIKYDTLKNRVKKHFAALMQNSVAYPHQQIGFGGLLEFLKMGASDRQELRDYILALETPRNSDYLTLEARSTARAGRSTWEQVVVRAREEGFKLIDNWDVRCVGRLIDLFPGAFNAQERTARLSAYMADNEDCDWMVYFDYTAKRACERSAAV